MKKILLCLSVFLLISCGKPSYEIFTFEEKIDLSYKVLKGDVKTEKEIDTIRENIKKAIKSGDEKAKREEIEWAGAMEMAENMIIGERIKEQAQKDAQKTLKIGL